MLSRLALVLLVSASASCANKARECNDLATAINQAANAFKKMGEIAEKNPAQTASAADECSKVTKEALAKMAAMPLKVKELQGFSTQYQEMAKNAVAAVDDLRGVLNEIGKMESKATAQGKAVEAAGTAFGTDCAANPKALDACQKFQTILTGLSPTDPDVFTKQIADLKAVPMGNEALKKSSGALIAQLESSVTITRESQRLANRAEEIGKKFEKEGAKEDAIVDGVNKFCGLK